jgi:hypothetical protein
MKKCKGYNKLNTEEAERCTEKVSNVDPERLYCAKHRICVAIVVEEKSETVKKYVEKFLDYETFSFSLLTPIEMQELGLGSIENEDVE